MNVEEDWSPEVTLLRGQIEQLDRELVDLIAKRVQLARQIGQAKRAVGVPTLDPPREATVVRRAVGFARECEISEEDVRQIFWQLIGMSRRAQAEAER